MKSFSIWVRNYLFLKNCVILEGAALHGLLPSDFFLNIYKTLLKVCNFWDLFLFVESPPLKAEEYEKDKTKEFLCRFEMGVNRNLYNDGVLLSFPINCFVTKLVWLLYKGSLLYIMRHKLKVFCAT